MADDMQLFPIYHTVKLPINPLAASGRAAIERIKMFILSDRNNEQQTCSKRSSHWLFQCKRYVDQI